MTERNVIMTRASLGRTRLLGAVCAALLPAIAPAGAAGAATSTVTISGASPLTAPIADGGSCDNRERFHDYEFGPAMAMNPANGHNLAVAWVQDDSDAVVVGSSTDGGSTWNKAVPPYQGHCHPDGTDSPGLHTSSYNPHIAFAADGTLYLATSLISGDFAGAITVTRSHDGGRTWDSHPALLATDPGTGVVDWSTVRTDPVHPRVAYVGWDSSPTYPFGQAIVAMRTTDGGDHWSGERGSPTAKVLAAPPEGAGNYQMGDPVPVGTGVVSTFRICVDPTCAEPELLSVTCPDWDSPCESPVVIAPNATALGSLQVTPGGSLVQVWTDGVLLHVSRSTDGGRSWSDATPGPYRFSSAPFGGTVATAPDGTLGVLFYDHRDAPVDRPGVSQLWLLREGAGGTWRETRIGGPFDVDGFPQGDLGQPATGVGEYQGLVGGPFGWAMAAVAGPSLSTGTGTTGPSDIAFTKLTAGS